MRGNITKRGKSSWRIKIDVGRDANGERKIHWETVRGKKDDAERALTALLKSYDHNTLVDHSKVNVAEYIRSWLDTAEVSPKTAERYRQLAEQQIIPHLGSNVLQKLKPAQVKDWHQTLLKSGGKDARPLSARTVGHAHRVLHCALAAAVASEMVARNVASAISAPKVEEEEVEILSGPQIADVLAKLNGHALFPIVALGLGTGMRRGGLLGLQWGDVDLDGASLRVERSVEETKAGLRVKPPKTKQGRRSISLPASAVDALRSHRKAQLETRLALGLGRPEGDVPVFCTPEGGLLSPDNLSRDWRRAVTSRRLPPVMFHALRHTHASALIDSGMNILSISRRLGRSKPTVTLNTYGHLFQNKDLEAAAAIEAVLRG